MEQQILNIQSPRARKARYAQQLSSKTLQIILLSVIILSFAGGIFLLYQKISLGFIALLPGVICVIIRWWYKVELEDLAVDSSLNSIDSLLEPSILANLKNPNPSAYELWRAVSENNAWYFFQNRYMLNPSIFEEMLSKEPGSSAPVWAQIETLRKTYNTTGFPASIVIVGLLKNITDIKQLLRKANIEIKDIELGIQWLEDISAKQRLALQKQHFGGWARDWAYGYTPLLRYLGHNISEEVQYHGFFVDTSVHKKLVEQMLNSMGSGDSVTLVGDVGVGKTTSIYAFALRLLQSTGLPKSIRHNQIISLDAPTLLAQAKGPGQLEELVIRLLNEAIHAKNIILFFDNAEIFFGQGPESIDLSNIIQPVLESGSVKLIFTMTPKQWQNIGTANPGLVSRLQSILVQPSDENETLLILKDKILFIEYQKKAVYTYQAIKEGYKLGLRYVDSQQMPGAALSVLEAAASSSTDGYITAEVVQKSIESSIGVKIQHANSGESQKLLNLEGELHKYVINQNQAVKVIADALRRSRSGVGNPERPVGTFLFLGPTGVGKTELSKALARVYFGDEGSMIRVDMNQYVSPEDVDRLITPMIGEQLNFLGQVRKRPFSVILLDEIEKAHKNVINLLLQMLDEGVMKDVNSKPVSFKDAIIIATSNAGANEIRRLIDDGKDIVKLQATLVDLVIEQNIFAPEFINRFDEVVVFRPLTPEELVQVIDLIIAGINKTLDSRKVQVEVSQPAKKWLVEKGYDAKLGARPMRRVVQHYVENILAKRLLEQTAGSGSIIKLDVSDFEKISET